MLWPASTAAVASRHSRSSAGAMPAAPSAAGQVMSSVSVLKRPADFREVAVGQDRPRHFQPVMRPDFVTEEVRPRPDHRDQ